MPTPPYPVLLASHQVRFDAEPGMTLLEAAEWAGYELPSSCRSGACRTCIARLQSGQVHYEMDWPSLSKEEKRDGYILPCVAYPDSPLVFSL